MWFVYAKFSNYGRALCAADCVEIDGGDPVAGFAAWAKSEGYTRRINDKAYAVESGHISVAYIGASIDRSFAAMGAGCIKGAALAGATIHAEIVRD